jgi:hypothetical protein
VTVKYLTNIKSKHIVIDELRRNFYYRLYWVYDDLIYDVSHLRHLCNFINLVTVHRLVLTTHLTTCLISHDTFEQNRKSGMRQQG